MVTIDNCFALQPDDDGDFPINKYGPTRVIVVDNTPATRDVVFCEKFTTGRNVTLHSNDTTEKVACQAASHINRADSFCGKAKAVCSLAKEQCM